MGHKIFYSWQSDLPAKTNRNFIKSAIEAAIKEIIDDPEYEEAVRESIGVDQDTAGVPGSPPIADTIFQKVTECSVFIADLTFVHNKRIKGRKGLRGLPNPNVLIEYGWALKALTHNQVIGVMNEAYGKADERTLPFDIRHTRWPIRYSLVEGVTEDQRRETKKALVKKLKTAIGLVLTDKPIIGEEPHVEIESKTSPARYYDLKEPLVAWSMGLRGQQSYYGPRSDTLMFLRLIPQKPCPRIKTVDLANKLRNKARPMRDITTIGSFPVNRNSYGIISWYTEDDEIRWLTQYFNNREIWGINSDVARWSVGVSGTGKILIQRWFLIYEAAIFNYLMVAQSILELPPPITIRCGLVGIKSYALADFPGVSFGIRHMSDVSFGDEVIIDTTIKDYNVEPQDILSDFRKAVWDVFAVDENICEAAVRNLDRSGLAWD